MVKVQEKKVLLPSTIEEAIKKAGYTFTGVTIETAGTLEKSGDGFVLVARGSGQRYQASGDKLEDSVGKARVFKGDVTQGKDKEKDKVFLKVSSVADEKK